MVAGVGMGTNLALDGAVAHAFYHILYKALLFMGADALIHATGKRNLSDLGGLARAMPLTFFLYMIGALFISGFPLFNGFISKSMIVSAAAKDHLPIAECLLIMASIDTYLSVGLCKTPSYPVCASAFIPSDSHLPFPTMPTPIHYLLALLFCGSSSFLFSPSCIFSYKCEAICPLHLSWSHICYTLSIRQALYICVTPV